MAKANSTNSMQAVAATLTSLTLFHSFVMYCILSMEGQLKSRFLFDDRQAILINLPRVWFSYDLQVLDDVLSTGELPRR